MDKVSTYMSESVRKNDVVILDGILIKTFDTVKVVVVEIEKVGVSSSGVYEEILELVGDENREDEVEIA